MTDSVSQSQVAIFDEWGRMSRVARKDESEVAGIAPFRAALETIHVEAVECKRLRDSLWVQSREATRRLQELLLEGQDTAARLRSFVRGVFGPRSAKLVRYGIKLRKLRRPPRTPVPGEDLAG
jgi:hypothetical protein